MLRAKTVVTILLCIQSTTVSLSRVSARLSAAGAAISYYLQVVERYSSGTYGAILPKIGDQRLCTRP